MPGRSAERRAVRALAGVDVALEAEDAQREPLALIGSIAGKGHVDQHADGLYPVDSPDSLLDAGGPQREIVVDDEGACLLQVQALLRGAIANEDPNVSLVLEPDIRPGACLVPQDRGRRAQLVPCCQSCFGVNMKARGNPFRVPLPTI